MVNHSVHGAVRISTGTATATVKAFLVLLLVSPSLAFVLYGSPVPSRFHAVSSRNRQEAPISLLQSRTQTRRGPLFAVHEKGKRGTNPPDSTPGFLDPVDTPEDDWLAYQKATFASEDNVVKDSLTNVEPSGGVHGGETTSPLDWLSPVWKARALLLGAAALYGTNFSIVKILDDDLPVGVAATLRFGIASLCTLPWLLAPPKRAKEVETNGMAAAKDVSSTPLSLDSFHSDFLHTPTAGAILTGLEVGLWNSVGYLSQAIGLQTTDASKSAFLCSLAVVIVPLIEVATGKKLRTRELVGAAMAVVGVGFLELGDSTSTNAALLTEGDLASLLQPFAFGIAFWRMERAMRKYPNEANRNSAAQLLAVFCTSLVFCFVTERDSLMDVHQIQEWLSNPSILGALFWTGTITTALTVYMEAVALKTLSAAETTVLLSAEPLFGAFFASLLIGETFGADAAIGAALIVVGCIYSNLGLKGLLGQAGGAGRAESNMDAVELSGTLQNETSSPTPDKTDESQPSFLTRKSGLAAVAGSFVTVTAKTVAVSAATSEELELVEGMLRNTTDIA